MGKYAVLLSGGISKKHNHLRYKNDLEWIYKVLVEDCGYHGENIKLFYADGKQLFYQRTALTTNMAKKQDIIQYLEEMADLLSEEDCLTLVVSNHGGEQRGGCIYLWGTEPLELDVLAQLLNRIKAKKNVILGECYAGNIMDTDISNACVVTANQKGLVSFGHPDQYEYDEMIFHFFSFIHTKYPDGTAIPNGENDVKKAYEYALQEDTFGPGNPKGQAICAKMKMQIEEIPQIKCNIEGTIRL